MAQGPTLDVLSPEHGDQICQRLKELVEEHVDTNILPKLYLVSASCACSSIDSLGKEKGRAGREDSDLCHPF